MKPYQKPAHKSKWRSIIVFGDNTIKVFNLTKTGRLTMPFVRKKPRNMVDLINSLKNKHEKDNDDTRIDIDINTKLESILNCELLENSCDNLELTDQLDSLEVLELDLHKKD